MPGGFEEAEIREGLREGGSILAAFIVRRTPSGPPDKVGPEDTEYVAYLRASWRRGFHILKTYKHRTDKLYMGRGLARLAWLLWEEFGHTEPLTLYKAGSEALQRSVDLHDLQPADRGRAAEDPGPPRAAPPKPPWEWPVRDPRPRDPEGTSQDAEGNAEEE